VKNFNIRLKKKGGKKLLKVSINSDFVRVIARSWPVILIPILFDVFKIAAIYMSKFLGYNLYLHENFGLLTLKISKIHIPVTPPLLFPSIQGLGLLENITNKSLSFYNKSWEAMLALGAFLFLSGLLFGGFYGTIKDSFRFRRMSLKAFTQFAWYYGPRFFIMLLFYYLFTLALSEFIDSEIVNYLAFFIKNFFIFLPCTIVMEDYGFFEALVASFQIFFRYFRYFFGIMTKILTVNIIIELLFRWLGAAGLIVALIVWPLVGTIMIYAIVYFFNYTVMKEPVAERPREHIRGYGRSIVNSAIVLLLVATVAGMPTFIRKIGYTYSLMPWHEPVISRDGIIYKSEGGRVFAQKNNLKNIKLLIDSLSPSREEILYAKPGLIRGKGRLLGNSKLLYFTFELTKTVDEQDNVIYSLEKGGKVEATDGLWGNPVDRGMILVIDGNLDYISGIIYDKVNYAEFDTLWSPKRNSVFLGPTINKNELYGFYAASELPGSPIEFQWLYNSAIPVHPEGENDYIKLLEKLNLAFETLDRDMLLSIMYYVNNLKPDDVLAQLEKDFAECRRLMAMRGLQNWEQNVATDVSYYYNSSEKITLVGDYFFVQQKIGFRAELYKIGKKWKITKMLIKDY